MNNTSLGPIILDIEGLTLTKEDEELIAHPNVGGVIFFSRNFENKEQLAALAQHIKSIRDKCVLCVDQEGGRVQRFKHEMTRLPPLRILGELLDSNVPLAEVLMMSEKLGLLMALEVRSLGVDLSFAPVLDCDIGISEVIGNRAFHANPEYVAQLAGAYIKGMAIAGMKATGKHFPGHGSVKLDSHYALPEDNRTLSELQSDMLPFIRLIHEGMAAIMPAHIVYPEIDPYPVGFSPFWIKEVLRKQCKFSGTIVSDDLSMEGAAGLGNYAMRAQRALSAGCDFVLVCNNRQGAIEALENIEASHDSETLARRLNLCAEGEVPSWRQLNQSPIWRQAIEVLKRIKELSNYEIAN